MTRLLRLSLIALCLFAVACATGGAPKSVDTQTPVDTTGVVDTQVSIDTSPSLDSDPSVDLEPPNDEISPPDVAPDGSVPLTTSVATVQNTQASTVCPPVGTSTDPQFQTFGNVTLVNVVVIGLPHYAGTGYERIYVADPGGGPYSGIAVDFAEGTLSVVEGEILDIKGTLEEYYCLTRIKLKDPSTDVTHHDKTSPPAPVSVTCSDLAQRDTAEPYEGVLVEVENVTLVAEGSFGQIDTLEGCHLDDDLRPYGQTTSWPAPNTKLSKLRGVVTYGFGVYRILPRTSADLEIAP